MRLRPALALISLALTVPFAACGDGQDPVSEAHTEGIYVTTGDLKYQVQISRILNPYDVEDRDYFIGVDDPEGQVANQEFVWYGVFLRVENKQEKAKLAASRFELVDTQGTHVEPEKLSEENVHAYRPVRLGEDDVIPEASSTAGQGAIGGSLVLFKTPREVLENRPTQLHIISPDGSTAHVNLDV